MVHLKGSFRCMVYCARKSVGAVLEIVQSKGSENGDDDIVMRHVQVKRLVKRELRNVVIIGIVDTGVAGCDQLGIESGRQF